MIYSLQTRNKLETRIIYLFSFVQNQSVASNEPHNPAWSQWTPWPPQWLLVILFAFTFVDYLWLLSGHHCTQWILFAFVVVNESTCNSEVYLHLCVVDISIWTVYDAYCELCVMSGVRYMCPYNKNGKYMVALPSVILGKETFYRVPA